MSEWRLQTEHLGPPKGWQQQEDCVASAILKTTHNKNKWVARIFEEWVKLRFLKVDTFEPCGVFRNYDVHKIQSLEIPLVQMDAPSLNYWLTTFNKTKKWLPTVLTVCTPEE